LHLRDAEKAAAAASFHVMIAPSILFMMTAYPKSEPADLTAAQRKAILVLLDDIKGDKT